MMRSHGRASVLLAGLAFAASASMGQAPEGRPAKGPAAALAGDLIPRSALFGNPDKVLPRISPDGKWIAYVAPHDGVLNVWVAPIDRVAEARPITNDRLRGIRQYYWAYDSAHILYPQDQGGDENWKIFAVNVETAQARDLTPFDSIPGPDGKPLTLPNNTKLLRPAAQIQEMSEKHPQEVLIALNNRNPALHDIHRVNIKTGEMTLVQQNDGYAGFVTDDDYNVRFAIKPLPDGGQELLIADGKGGFAPYQRIGMEDALTTSPLGFDKSGRLLYMIDSRGRDTAALTVTDIAANSSTVLAEDPRVDAGGVLIHPTEKTVQAVGFNYDRLHWKVLDKSIEGDLEYLKTVCPGDLTVDSRSLDDRHWVVSYRQDTGPTRSYHYDRGARKAHFLFSSRAALEGLPLATMHPVVIEARDGLKLVSYLTLPRASDPDGDGRPEKPVPMVLNVHGGPWGRDMWGFNSEVQWLANRGYAVLQVNFRGSTGFGKNFINAGNRQWSAKMHDDLVDAVNWAVEQKIADKDKIAIYGGSYGGYATLVGLTMTPDLFACGVDIVGPSNLITLLNNIPPYWAPFLPQLKTRVGDHTTEEGRKYLESISPINHAGKIKRPLLIGQGYNDPRVNHEESGQIVRALEAKKIPVTYVVYPDEGHGFARPQNRTSFYAVSEAFLATHLGGRVEPFGDDLKGSSIQVPNGVDQIPGLSEALHDAGLSGR